MRRDVFFRENHISSIQTQNTTFLEIFSSFFVVCHKLLYFGMMNFGYGGGGN